MSGATTSNDCSRPGPRLLAQMMLIRKTEQTILAQYRKGTISGAVHLSIGQEAIPVGVCAQLCATDLVFSTHRGHGHAIAKGVDLNRLFAELMGRETGLCHGHGGSMHLFDVERGLMGGNGIVGAGLALALGPAFAAQYRSHDHVSVCFFGDGAANQGTFHESLNLAALWKLPVVFVCENNGYAATTPVAHACASPDIAGRAAAYGARGARVDGNDVEAVSEAAARAVGLARGGEGPSLLECVTYRMEPHCGIIADGRDPGEKEQWRRKDPIDLLTARLVRRGELTGQGLLDLTMDIERKLEEAVAFALASPCPDPAVSVRTARGR